MLVLLVWGWLLLVGQEASAAGHRGAVREALSLRANGLESRGAGVVSLLQTGATTGRVTWNALETSDDASIRERAQGRVRKASDQGIISRDGITRHNSQKGFYRPSHDERKDKEKEGIPVDWSIEGMPDPNDWDHQNEGALSHHDVDMGGKYKLMFNDLYMKTQTPSIEGIKYKPVQYKYKGVEDRLKETHANPDSLAIHPSVQINTAHPSDFTQGGADYEEDLPEPMAPQPPFLNTEKSDVDVPVAYRAFYPTSGQRTYANDMKIGDDCVRLDKLPYIRSLAPSKVGEKYCVPRKFLPYYHPDDKQTAQPGNEPAKISSSPSLQPMPVSAQYDFPMPFQHGPMYPPFSPPGPGDPSINPPPTVPLPAPADFNGNARRTPTMPMPPLPPAMWPYG